jgi:hypothetical protein
MATLRDSILRPAMVGAMIGLVTTVFQLLMPFT